MKSSLSPVVRSALAAFLLTVSSFAPAGALPTSGLLPNPDFHEPEGVGGVAGWTELFPDISEMNVIADDADDCIDSGAGDAINTNGEDAGTTAYVGCSNVVVEGEAYRLTGAFRFPVGTDPSDVSAFFAFHPQVDCLGSFLATSFSTPSYPSDTTLDWTRFAIGPKTAPAGSLSIGVRIILRKEFGVDNVSDVYFDTIYLTPADFVFVDDFERGSACRWSEELGLEP